MRQACVTPKATKAFRLHLLTVLFFCVIVPACDNGCFIFVSNPSGGTIAVGTSTCKLSNVNGTVSMQFTSSLQPISGQSSSIQHVFVSLRGIEAHPSATADEDSPDWQELVPTLKKQPWSGMMTPTRSIWSVKRLSRQAHTVRFVCSSCQINQQRANPFRKGTTVGVLASTASLPPTVLFVPWL